MIGAAAVSAPLAELPHFDRIDDLGDNVFIFVHRAEQNNFEVRFYPEAT